MLRKSLPFIILLLLALQISADDAKRVPTEFQFDIGDKLPENINIDTSNSILAYVNPGYSLPVPIFPSTINGVMYYFAFGLFDFENALEKREILSIKTSDSSFISPEGFKIGDKLSKVLLEADSLIDYVKSYSYDRTRFAVLPSGWKAGVVKDSDSSENNKKNEIDPADLEENTIKYFLKQDFWWNSNTDSFFLFSDSFKKFKSELPKDLIIDTNRIKFISVYPLVGTFYKFYATEVNNVTYYINYEDNNPSNPDYPNNIRTVYVRDSNFTTPEGISINDSLPREYLTYENRFDYIRRDSEKNITIVKFPSGWFALATGQEIQYFYQSKYLKRKPVNYKND